MDQRKLPFVKEMKLHTPPIENNYGEPSVLSIETCCVNNKTILKDAFFTSPLKVAKPFYKPNDDFMYLCILNTSAGILAGDCYNYNVVLGKNSKMDLYTQSFTKVYKMNLGCGSQICTFNLEESSFLKYIPLPVIPFAGSNFESMTIVKMEEGSRLIFGDILACGRYKRGEAFQFKKYISKVMVYYMDRLIYVDNLLLDPEHQDLSNIGFYEGHTHYTSLLIVDEEIDDMLLNDIRDYLSQCEKNVEYGVTKIYKNGLSVRILGDGGEMLKAVLDEISNIYLLNYTKNKAGDK